MIILYLVWMFLKLVKGKGVISHFSYLDVLKIRMKKRGNDLNRQIYPYLICFKIKIFLHFLINQTENKEHSNHRLSLKYISYINFPIKESNEI